eukprot:sb/3474198/
MSSNSSPRDTSQMDLYHRGDFERKFFVFSEENVTRNNGVFQPLGRKCIKYSMPDLRCIRMELVNHSKGESTRYLKLFFNPNYAEKVYSRVDLSHAMLFQRSLLRFYAPRRWKAPCFTRLFYPTKNSEKMLKIPEKSKQYD